MQLQQPGGGVPGVRQRRATGHPQGEPPRRLDVNQHAKWLDACRHIPWRRPIASLTYLLTSHVWRQDHNGFSHQDPGFLDHVLNKKPQIVRAYLPPDANTLLSTMAHCLRTRDYVHVVVAGKQPGAAVADDGGGDRALHPRPGDLADVVLGCAGDVPTIGPSRR